MNPTTDLEPIGDLQDVFLADSLKILRNIKAVFETRTRRDASVNHDAGTLDKCALMELTSMLLGTGHEPAASMLDMVQYVFHDGLVAPARHDRRHRRGHHPRGGWRKHRRGHQPGRQ
jgi:hypothetical protein